MTDNHIESEPRRKTKKNNAASSESSGIVVLLSPHESGNASRSRSSTS
jgi:hypothetical protein